MRERRNSSSMLSVYVRLEAILNKMDCERSHLELVCCFRSASQVYQYLPRFWSKEERICYAS
jgi:hypothetical protein